MKRRPLILLEKLPYVMFLTKRKIYHTFKPGRPARINILFILGCQRSGTTLLTRIFENDLNMKVYGEYSVLSSGDKIRKIRLNPLPQVKTVLEGSRVPGVILKPLVESQNALSLLNYFENAKVLWVFRHYKDVASSSVRKFGEQNGLNNLRSIINRTRNNWRSEGVSDWTEGTVRSLYSETMSPYDAAALFWLVRNRLLYELKLHENSRVMLCKYDDLVSSPASVVRSIYEFMGCGYPGDRIVGEVHSDSIAKGKHIKLSPQIEAACMELMLRLDSSYKCRVNGTSCLSTFSSPGK